MHERPARILGYARVSTDRQEREGTSLDEQRDTLGAYCRANGYPEPVMHVETESGGGTGEARVEQRRLMASVRAGDLVLVTRQDRWSRDTIHFLKSAREIGERGARFFSIAEQFDLATPAGIYVATIMAATAENERARIRERTHGAKARLRSLGCWVEGEPPLGYSRGGDRKLVPNERAVAVRKMFRLAIEGNSTATIAARLSDDGIAIDKSGVARKLRDRRYLGEMPSIGDKRTHGRGAKGSAWVRSHEPLVDVATFEAAGAALVARRVGGVYRSDVARNVGHMLRGIARCERCGHIVTAHAPMAYESIRHGGYYVCRYPGCNAIGSLRQDAVDRDAESAALGRLDGIAEQLVRRKPARAAERPDFEAMLARVDRRRANLVEAIADGVLSRGAAREKLDDLDREARGIEERRIAFESSDVVIPIDVARAALREVKDIERAWRLTTPAEKGQIMELLSRSIVLGRDPAARKWARAPHTLTVAWFDLGEPSHASFARQRLAKGGSALARLLGRGAA